MNTTTIRRPREEQHRFDATRAAGYTPKRVRQPKPCKHCKELIISGGVCTSRDDVGQCVPEE